MTKAKIEREAAPNADVLRQESPERSEDPGLQLKGLSLPQQRSTLSPASTGYAVQMASLSPFVQRKQEGDEGEAAAPEEALDLDPEVEDEEEVEEEVQAKASKPLQLAGGDGAVHSVAARGIRSPSGSLPHLGTIQRSFGGHDVSGVKSHVAPEANAQLGSQAYATGDHVAFGSASPSLHTAAHEAAHIVQQRGGVQLAGGVGKAGDQHERHADQVADSVVAGKSAEGLLSSYGKPGGGASVQMRALQYKATPKGSVEVKPRARYYQKSTWKLLGRYGAGSVQHYGLSGDKKFYTVVVGGVACWLPVADTIAMPGAGGGGRDVGKGGATTKFTRRRSDYNSRYDKVNQVANKVDSKNFHRQGKAYRKRNGQTGHRRQDTRTTKKFKTAVGLTFDIKNMTVGAGGSLSIYAVELLFPTPIPMVYGKASWGGGGSFGVAGNRSQITATLQLSAKLAAGLSVGIPKVAEAYIEGALVAAATGSATWIPATGNTYTSATIDLAIKATTGLKLFAGLIDLPYELGGLELFKVVLHQGTGRVLPGKALERIKQEVLKKKRQWESWLGADAQAYRAVQAIKSDSRSKGSWQSRMQQKLSVGKKASMIGAINDCWVGGAHERAIVDLVEGTRPGNRVKLLQAATGHTTWKGILNRFDRGLDSNTQIIRFLSLLKGCTNVDQEDCKKTGLIWNWSSHAKAAGLPKKA